MRKLKLNRRSVLKGLAGGVGATLALPALEAMFNANGTAHADGTTLPVRFGVWWWGVGVILPKWVPSAMGPNFPASPELKPFFDAQVNDYVSVVSGYNSPFPLVLGHHDGWVAAMTGSNDTIATLNGGRPGDGNFVHPSIDQVVATQWAGKTKFDSLQLMVSAMGAGSNPNYCVDISQKGNNQTNPGFTDPKQLFSHLGFTTASADPKALQISKDKSSLLDGFVAEATALKARVGTTDKAKLDEYMTNLRSIESQLQAMPSSCATPMSPAQQSDNLGHEDLQGRGRLIADLLVTALACDLTRVFSLVFTPMQAMTIYWQLGSGENYHTLTHTDTNFCDKVVTFNMGEYAYLLAKLKGTTEGAGNLLDNCAIYSSTDVTEGYTHSTNDMPMLVCGKAGGALKSGQHIRGTGQSTTNVQYTVLKAIGMPMTQWGYNQGKTSTTVSALLT